MATVTEMLDRLHTGQATLEQVAHDFATRAWPAPVAPTEAQRWGVDDDPPADPNSWEAVNADSRLSTDQYQILAAASRHSH